MRRGTELRREATSSGSNLASTMGSMARAVRPRP